LEDDREAMRRLGASREIEPAAFRSAQDDLAPADAAKLAFAEAMIGNFDWCLKFAPQDTYRCDARKILWNVAAFGRDAGPAVAVIFDFDLAGMVALGHPWFTH